MVDTVERAIYELGVRGKEQLDAAARSLDGLAASEERVTRATRTRQDAADRMLARLDPRVRAEQNLARTQEAVTRLQQEGIGTEQKLGQIVDLATQRYLDQIDAVQRLTAVRQQSVLQSRQQAQAQFNSVLGVREPTTGVARASADAFLAPFGGLEGIAQERARETGLAFSTELNTRLVEGTGKSARGSAAVFEREMARLDDIARMRAQQVGAEFTRGLNERMGVGVARRSAAASASVFQDAFADEERLDRLRERHVPLLAFQRQYRQNLADIQDLNSQGILSERERAEAIASTKSAFAKQVSDLNRATSATGKYSRGVGLARHEVVNLSRQLQDVGVTAYMGMSPMLILAQQGTQIADVFASSQASVGGFFDQTMGWAKSILTPARLAAGAVIGIGAAAVTAAMQWGSTQREIQMSLAGAGRASGVDIGGINEMARGGAYGLSTSETRAFATELAATGKIGADAIRPVLDIAYDITRVFGVDAPQAAEMMAAALSDPIRGFDQLNQRLGFGDAATRRQVANLVEQNRLYDAQQLLVGRLAGTMEDIRSTTSSTSRFWATIGNAISNAWDRFGELAARGTGIGYAPGIDEQIENTRQRILEIEQILERRADTARRGRLVTELEAERAKLQELTGQWERYWQSVQEAQQRRDSLLQSAAVRAILPEIEQFDKLNNSFMSLSLTMQAVQSTGGATSPVLERMGVTADQLARALEIARARMAGFRSEADRATAQLQLQNESIFARSPSERADIARRSYILSQGQRPESADAVTLRNAEIAAQGVLLQNQRQMADASRDRLLTAQQRVEQAQLEIAIMGRSTIEQERARNILQARQQLEQEALRTYGSRQAYDRRHLEALTQQLNLESSIRQSLAEQQLQRDLAFERSQIGRDPTEAGVAERLRSVYGDQYIQHMDGAIAAQMRLNDQLKVSQDMATTFATSFAQDMMRGVSAQEALGNAVQRFAGQLVDMAVRNLVAQAFGGLLGLGGLGGTIGGTGGILGGLYANGAAFNRGNVIPFARGGVVNGPTVFPTANGMGLMGEAGPEAVMPLRRGRGGRLGVEMAGGGASAPVNLHVTVGWSRSADGNLQPFVESVAQRQVDGAAPRIVEASVKATERRRSDRQRARSDADAA